MIEVITAIALLCQVTGSYSAGNSGPVHRYGEAKEYQNKCHATLLKCVVEPEKNKTYEYKLKDCVLKGGY
jgi:hypothetical protein